MKRQADHLREIFDAARALSNPQPLSALMSKAEEAWLQEDPEYPEFWAAFHDEFGYFNNIAPGNQPLAPEYLAKWSNALAWAMQEFTGWSLDQPSARTKLRLLLIITGVMDQDGTFWPQMPDEIGDNEQVVAALANLIANAKFNSRPVGPAPTFEEEQRAFKAAENARDWAALTRLHDALSLPIIDPTCERATRILARYSHESLVQATHDLTQTEVAVSVTKGLTDEAALNLAIETHSPHMKFACVYQKVRARRDRPLSPIAQTYLVSLFVQISSDAEMWQAWMKVFNRYPPHFLVLQDSLGAALAEVSEAALRAYVDAISLSTHPDVQRGTIAACLRIFKEKADLSQRKSMWRAAYARWQDWNFDDDGLSGRLAKISWSQLDFAIVGYAVECMVESDRVEVLASIQNSLNEVEYEWHPDGSSFTTTRRRLLSRMQPIAHAQSVVVNETDWLIENGIYLPYRHESDQYSHLKYDDLGSLRLSNAAS